ncbi:response regulator transcription factor [Conexibacter sp. DBS9H8]|uniref:response regulator transcription factor n=1 Tax=Conexibacter sp. DBS9H8 TaxID=2937801 RepID=UPI00200D1C40|nr:response regulator transcription factor [Conexibacter sp. DBS9H8]
MILVVEDEPGILDFVERGLRRHGLEVDTATDGEAGLARALEAEIELVVLDLMLPRRSGQEVLGELRAARPELPVIVLTARGEVEDRVAGLDAGAVDYLVKPFSIDELAARVRAQLRSARRGDTTLVTGGIRVDLLSRDVTTVGDHRVRLSTTEFELLVFLMQHEGQVLARDQILRAVWGYQHDPGTNVLDVYIGYLRRKLSATEATGKITTVRSLGYRFDGEPR